MFYLCFQLLVVEGKYLELHFQEISCDSNSSFTFSFPFVVEKKVGE